MKKISLTLLLLIGMSVHMSANTDMQVEVPLDNSKKLVQDKLPLHRTINGIDGKIILLQDKNLPKGIPNSELEKNYENAILKIVDANNNTISSIEFKYPIASMERKVLKGNVFYFLHIDQYCGMGPYCGVNTLIYQVKNAKLIPQTYIDIGSKYESPVSLYQALRRSWQILLDREQLTIHQVFSNPGSTKDYISYVYNEGRWYKYSKTVDGFWEEATFPKSSEFLK